MQLGSMRQLQAAPAMCRTVHCSHLLPLKLGFTYLDIGMWHARCSQQWKRRLSYTTFPLLSPAATQADAREPAPKRIEEDGT